jgi:hypothetical protein
VNRGILGSLFGTIGLAVLALLSAAPGAPSVSLDSVVGAVFRRQQQLGERVKDVSYEGDYRYTETDLRQSRSRQVDCRRRVSMKGYERQRHDILSVSVDGRGLAGRELEREVRDLKSKGLVAGNTRMPLMTETRSEYHYHLLGTDSVRGLEAWVIGFEPARVSGRHIRGRALVLKDSFDVAGLQFAPAQVPFVVREMNLVLDYDRVQGLWLPVRFKMTLDLRLKFILTVLDRHIEIEDRYSNHRLNAGLDDSFFRERIVLPP